MVKFYLSLLLFTNTVLCQVTSDLLISNIKEKIYLAPGYNDIYFDLERKSITRISKNYNDQKEEDFIGYTAIVRNGSFINTHANEYLLIIKWKQSEDYFFFAHVENFGPMFQVVIFDSLYNQISPFYFQDASTEFKYINDIDNDGIYEVFLTGGYGNQGMFMEWLSVFYKDFEKPILNVMIAADNTQTMFNGEYFNATSTYYISMGQLNIETRIDYYIRMGKDDSRYLKTESCSDVYQYNKGIFKHIKNKLNCDRTKFEF